MPCVALLSLITFAAADQVCNQASEDFLDCLLPVQKAAKWAAPPGQSTIEISAYVVKISKLDTRNQQSFTTTIYFRHFWNDPRLAWDPAVQGFDEFHLLSPDRIWKPDTFFSHGSAKLENDHEQFVKLNSSGAVIWSQRLILQVLCPMNFRYFPFDIQHCDTNVETYGTLADRVVLAPSSRPEFPALTVEQDQNGDELVVGSYRVTAPEVLSATATYGGKVFPTLKWRFTFTRGKAPYFINTFFPLWLVVLLATLGPFINPEAVPARASLGITTVLVLISLMFVLTRSLPEQPTVSYLDVYMLMCFVYVTLCCIEFTYVNYLLTRLSQRDRSLKEKSTLIRKMSTRRLSGFSDITPQRTGTGTSSSPCGPPRTGTSSSRQTPRSPRSPEGRPENGPYGARRASHASHVGMVKHSPSGEFGAECTSRDSSVGVPAEIHNGPPLEHTMPMAPIEFVRKRDQPNKAQSKKRRKSLTKGERLELRSLFHACDTDGQGSISKEELRPVLQGLASDEELIDSIIAKVDVDGSGTINFEEFTDMVLDLQELAGIAILETKAEARTISYCCGRLSASRLTVDVVEETYRKIAPCCFVIATAIWFGVVLSHDQHELH